MAGAVAALLAWSWWTAGTRPFEAAGYVAVGVPSAILLVAVGIASAAPAHRRAARASYRSSADRLPVVARVAWIVWVGAAAGCEAVALWLGGRSATVATLSTTVDHLLGTRLGRAGLVALWLAVGGIGVARLARASRGRLR